MDIGADCKQCRGRGSFGGRAYVSGQRTYEPCDLCSGSGTNNGQPTTEEYVWVGQGVQVSAAAIYAEADARQFADDAGDAERERYGRWIGTEFVMPKWVNGKPIYEMPY